MNKTQKIELWAFMERQPSGQWKIVDVSDGNIHWPLISSNESMIKKALSLVDSSVKGKSKLVKFVGEVYL